MGMCTNFTKLNRNVFTELWYLPPTAECSDSIYTTFGEPPFDPKFVNSIHQPLQSNSTVVLIGNKRKQSQIEFPNRTITKCAMKLYIPNA
jgi:hypothetical protein